MKLNAVIVDDCKDMRLVLRNYLSNIPFVNIIGESDNGDDGFKLIINKKPHVAFLDVQMPGMDGLKVAKLTSEIDENKTFLIFATAYNEFALDAFEYHAYDYLIKPYDFDRIKRTLGKLYKLLNGITKKSKVVAKTENGIALLNPADIIFITKEGRETHIHTTLKIVKSVDTLETFERNLNDYSFVRCHKSYIINVEKINLIQSLNRKSCTIILDGTDEVIIMPKEKAKELQKSIAM